LTATTTEPGAESAPFAARHGADHTAVGIMMGLIWFVILAGFVPDMMRRVTEHAPPYQLVTHAHAFLAVTWLVLLTSQSALIRMGDTARHIRIGRIGRWAGLALFAASVATALSADLSRLHAVGFQPQRLAFQLSHILVFGGLAIWAFASTKDPAAHKRLILLATLAMADAGASRWLGDELSQLLGDGFFGQWAIRYPIPLALVGAIGVYDLVTRRRLHPVYLPAAGLIAGSQLLAIWLSFQPAFIAACGAFLSAL
jgi:hypothetical protein